jgi:nucleoside 2-deoxyribosyltransferase
MSRRIYLASPYSSPNASIRHQRWIDACRATAHLMRQGLFVFSPIAHSHSVEIHGFSEPQSGKFWMAQDLPWLERSDELCVLLLTGFLESTGVKQEIAFAGERGMPIWYLDPAECGI